MSKENTHQKKKEKKWGKKKRERDSEREREREPKKPKITPKTLNHQIQMAHTKKNTCVSPAATGICPKFRAQKNTTPEAKKQLQFSFQKRVWRRFP